MKTAEIETYSEAVQKNLDHMGTPAWEWRAVKVTGMASTTGPTGSPVSMPIFDFPAGYTPAPTLYPQSVGLDGGNCELCNHPIKRAYHIQHDANRWILTVGSECVTHFAEGKNGEQVARQDIKEANRQLIRDTHHLRKQLLPLCSRQETRWTSMGQEYTTTAFYPSEALRYYAAIGCNGSRYAGRRYNLGEWHNPPQIIPEIPTDERHHWDGEPIWTDRQISNWLKKHRPALEAFIAEVREKFPQIFA